MRKTMIIENAILSESLDGFWLQVTDSKGRQAAICLDNLNDSRIVVPCFVQWAKDNLDKQEPPSVEPANSDD